MLTKSLCTSVHSSTIHHCPKNGMKASNKQANKYIYNCLKRYVRKRNEQYTETTSLRTEYLKCREVQQGWRGRQRFEKAGVCGHVKDGGLY